MFERLIHRNVRARAPLRLGLGGGGTDLLPYCDDFGGVVLNATIDRYAYAHLASRDDGRIVLRADDLGSEDELPATLDFSIREGLVLHRATYKVMMERYNDGKAMPLTISTTIDVPAGSGLGASSALTVALIEAFALALKLPLGPYEIAEMAYDIERVQLGMLGGKQDQYAAAFGGFNFIEFLKGGVGVIVNPLRLHRDCLNEFESSLVICFSGQSRESARIIEDQVSGLKQMDDKTIVSMHEIKEHATRMKTMLLGGQIRQTANVLQQAWQAKKNTASTISNSTIDGLLDVAMRNGAWGGKVSGAGGGGFIMLLANPSRRHHLIEALDDAGGNASAVRLTFEGVEAWVVPE
ncbi:dehydrogenase [Sphingomonas sp. H39-1-10]|uniref:GHMP family kinase ATP-binding protein n=1 Tax=Sphingomonas pollutisoli TaxID=3030829 RepID=UPI0023BA0216|nr:dehydrogenase [Sphingomonas pollutisoli]MDF0490969.1 dehydrogenase [Sphingomonas pollutisoli]